MAHFNDVDNGREKSACTHFGRGKSACAHFDDEGKGKSACAHFDDGGKGKSACAHYGGEIEGIGIESACALDIRIFCGPPDSSSQRGLVLKIKQLVNYKCELNK